VKSVQNLFACVKYNNIMSSHSILAPLEVMRINIFSFWLEFTSKKRERSGQTSGNAGEERDKEKGE